MTSTPIIRTATIAALLASCVSCGSKSSSSSSTDGRSCPSLTDGPSGFEPLPSAPQLAYQRTEMTAFIHFGMATFDGTEQGDLSVDEPSLFDPSNLNADTVGAWVSALKDAGFGQAMLVTKHSTGFCLWPSEYTDYSVKSSPWMDGKGDVVKLFTDAMHEAGLRVALYLAPWDQTFPSTDPDYETYFKNQLTELLTNYGPVYEIEFDGYHAPTDNVDWESVFALAKELQPDILIWAGPEIVQTGAVPDLEWIGNEHGQANRTTSSVDTWNCGGGDGWCPFECNVSDRTPYWFWHPDQKPMTLDTMKDTYYSSVGLNCTLIYNVPPTTTGEFDPDDVDLLQQFGSWYSDLYKTNLLEEQPATADSTWEKSGFEADKAVDGDVCTYWAAESDSTTARLEVTPSSPVTFNVISIREPIELGERVTQYHVEIKQDGEWNTTPLTKLGAKVQGTVIGQRQLWQLNSTTAEAVALVIDSAKDVPAIAEFGVMNDESASDSETGPITGNDGVLCPLPDQPLITDFTYAGDGADTTGVHFGSTAVLSGGEYIYPTTGSYPLVSDVTDSNWHITGTVGDYSGFGLYFDNCNRVDASAYQGISFTVSGSVGDNNEIVLNVGTLNDSIAAGWINTHGGTTTDPGRCVPETGTNQYDQQDCKNPTVTIPVSDTPTEVTILWSDFEGGSPEPNVATPSEITFISWSFPWTSDGTAYPVDLTIDDLSFVP